MKLFRIITDQEIFKVQRKSFFGLFWKTFQYSNERGEYDKTFKSKEDAEEFLRIKKLDYGISDKKWTVVK